MTFATRGALATVNHLLGAAPWARERLALHQGRHARVRAEPFELLFAIAPDGFLIAPAPDATPDVTLSMPASTLPSVVGGGAERLLAAMRIDGNAEFADALGFVFRNLRWDVEEDLSRLVGDIVAHRAVAGAQALLAGARRTGRALGGNVAEYLVEEQAALVGRGALGVHAAELTRLRDDLARLEKRAEQLSARAAGGTATSRRTA